MQLFSLIKKGLVVSNRRKVIPAEEFSQALEGQELISAAKEDAATIIEDAQKEAEEIKKAAQKAGFEEGLNQFSEHILLFENKVRALRLDIQKKMLPLVLKSTQKIVGKQLEIHPETIVNIVIEAIKSVTKCQVVSIYVNKNDLQYLEKESPKIRQLFENVESFKIEARADIEPGNCIIETERGILNATLENQYRALERAFETFSAQ